MTEERLEHCENVADDWHDRGDAAQVSARGAAVYIAELCEAVRGALPPQCWTLEGISGRADTPDKKRAIIGRVLAAWLARPELRLGQLIDCAQTGQLVSLFMVEDADLVEWIDEFVAMEKEMEDDKTIEALRRDNRRLTEELDEARKAARAGNAVDPWGWVDDGYDHLESMGDEMAVRITAGHLRRLIGSNEALHRRCQLIVDKYTSRRTREDDTVEVTRSEPVWELARALTGVGPPLGCPIAQRFCPEHNFWHGAEAEELRAGIEHIIHQGNVDVSDLQRLLDRVDARDSLAYREATDAT